MPSLPSLRPSSTGPSPAPPWWRRPEIVLASVVAVAVVVVVLIAVLGRGSRFDRAGAVARVVDESDGRISAEQAGCYVDRVRREVGARYLRTDSRPPDEVIARLTAIRVDCIGVANLGVATTAGAADTEVPLTEAGNLPRRPGDDPTLDQLYAACGAGSGPACDQLFALAPIGSEYEAFALTCGGRTSERSCADAYPAPTTTASTPAP